MKFSTALLFALASPAFALRGAAQDKDDARSLEAVYNSHVRKLTAMQANDNFRKLLEADESFRNLLEAGAGKASAADYKRSLVEAEASFRALAQIDEHYRKLLSVNDDETGPVSQKDIEHVRALQYIDWDCYDIENINSPDWRSCAQKTHQEGVNTEAVTGCSLCFYTDDDDTSFAP